MVVVVCHAVPLLPRREHGYLMYCMRRHGVSPPRQLSPAYSVEMYPYPVTKVSVAGNIACHASCKQGCLCCGSSV